MSARAVPEGIRITKVGLWYVLITLVVGFAGANTGNNALLLVEALLLGVLIVSGFSSRRNVRKLEFHLTSPREIYAEQPHSLNLLVRNLDRFFSRRILVVSCPDQSAPLLIPSLGRSKSQSSRLDLCFPNRGKVSIPHVHVASIFPVGIFHKGQRYPVGLEFLVFPKIRAAPSLRLHRRNVGDGTSLQAMGRGHELLSLRDFRAGDEQRSVHWKRTARTGEIIVIERESEQDQKVTIVLDNGVGKIKSEFERDKFESLVSEAATAAYYYLESGFEIEFLSRDLVIPFGRGQAHRIHIMEYLALVEPTEISDHPLGTLGRGTPSINLSDALVQH